MKTNRLYQILLPIAFISCDSGVRYENVPLEDLLSVSAFISPQDTLFTVHVYHALRYGNIDNPDLALVKDAQVIISDHETADTLHYNQTTTRYEATPKHLLLKQYHQCFLTVRTASGLKIKSSCTIPPEPEVPNLNGEWEGVDYLFKVAWNNPSNFANFTLVTFGEGYYDYEYPWGTVTEQITARLMSNVIFPSNGQTEYNEYEGIVIRAGLSEHPKLTISLRNVDSNMFKYFESYRAFGEWDANNSGSLLPNFKQPSPVFSNIENGVGIFAAYNSSHLQMDLK